MTDREGLEGNFIAWDFGTDAGHCLYGRVLPDGSFYFLDEKEFIEFPEKLKDKSGVIKL